MHSFKSLILSFLVVFAAFAQPEGEVVIRTRDGKSRQGRVISETQKGYLFASSKGTSVIPFEIIVDMKSATNEPEPAPVATPVVVAVASPVVESPPPPPPSAPSALPSIAEVTAAPEAKSSRRGFHFGLGAVAGGGRFGANAGAQVIFDFNFGLPAYRLAINLGPAVGYGVGINGSIDNLFHLNFGNIYTLGIGARVGLLIGSIGGVLYVGPVLQPVIIKLGDRGQHQLSLSLAAGPASSTVFFEGSLGYAFLF